MKLPPLNKAIAFAVCIAVLPSIGVAQNSQRFNLVCEHQQIAGKKPFITQRSSYRVDLQTRRWCPDNGYGCTIRRFGEERPITGTSWFNRREIVFAHNYYDDGGTYSEKFERDTGRYVFQNADTIRSVGTCTRRPFSGFSTN